MKNQTATNYPDDFILCAKKLYMMYGLSDMPMDCLFIHMDSVGKMVGWTRNHRQLQYKFQDDGYIEAFDYYNRKVTIFMGNHHIVRFTEKFVKDFI